MTSDAVTVAEYLERLPIERRDILETVRSVILKNLDSDIEEGIQYGMIGYYIPHRVYPAGYHCDRRQPLPYAALASQKNHLAVYLTCIYQDEEHKRWLEKAWEAAGKKRVGGKACIRFKKLSELPLEVLGEAIRRVPAQAFIRHYEGTLKPR